ncbi:MAG: hypothetical protein OEO23_09935 [Gemmatimonadota bacterium]|nr:hypothetical protein [Gemmatimonadota bacterium]
MKEWQASGGDSANAAHVVLLGPQRYERTLRPVAEELFPEGPVATVTAGWQEWERDDRALDRDLDGRSVNLELYRRAEHVFQADPELAKAHRHLQTRLRLLKKAYHTRLELAYRAWEAVDRIPGDDAVLGPEREAAFQVIRELDTRHIDRVSELRAEFERRLRPTERDAVARQRAEMETILGSTAALVIEGGHVPVLLNRFHIFGLTSGLSGRTVVACAGGAMVLAPRVVFFHDSPPQGSSIPEAAEAGVGLFEGVVVLPDAGRRLELGNRDRVSRLARRFEPYSCIALDGGSRIDWDGSGWRPGDAGRLTSSGKVERWRASA